MWPWRTTIIAAACVASGCLGSPARPTADSDATIMNDAAVDGPASPFADALVDGPSGADARITDAVMSSNTHSAQFTAASDHYLSAADDNVSGLDITGAITFEAWFELASLPSDGNRFALAVKQNVATVDNSYSFEIKNEGGLYRMEGRVDGTASGSNGRDGVGWNLGGLAPGVWHHVAVTYDLSQATVGERFRFFVDGAEVVGGVVLYNDVIDTIRNSGTPLTLGSRIGNGKMINQLDGQLDDVRVWSVVRTPAEIAAAYATELTGAEPNLLGYWQFDGDLVDATGRGNDLAQNGSTEVELVSDAPF